MTDAARPSRQPIPPAAGLCAACVHAQPITSSRGVLFVLCALSVTDQRFVKYPRLPVVQCSGYEARPTSPEVPSA